MRPTMKSRFTPAEANRTLPLVKRIVADILERGKELRALIEQGGDTPNEEAERETNRLENELHELMRELMRIGCFYKDWGFEMGLVDFPAELDGRTVLLCWRSDEESVTWYHPVDGGFAARQKIPAELL